EYTYAVQAARKTGETEAESEVSAPFAITPRDTFPPAVPKGLTAVAGTGTMNLSWDANTEADLAGYLVLRGDAPGDTLQPLTPAPIAGTSYEDKTVTPGVRYVYAIVAVDKASPPNRSAPSLRVEETAR
nr:fibronectin type III domain-containing protein [Acidobacteriota bacterium]